MDTADTAARRPSADGGPLSAATATPRQRGAGIALAVAGAASNQGGAALGAVAFPAIGPVGVVAVRQLVTAVVLAPLVRPRFRGLRRDQWWPVLGLVVVFSVMNLGLYAAVERIGLGLAVTLEILGPLAVAVAGSRRVLDLACVGLAGAGVVVLTGPGPVPGPGPGPGTDVVGVALALLAALGWAAYILLNRTVGQRLPGLQGTAAAAVVTAVVWTPVAATWFVLHPPTAAAVALAVGCGLLSSIAPYVADLLALRRVTAPVFGTLTSVNPVWAALAGWLLLDQALAPHEQLGIALVVAGSALVSARALAGPGPRRGGRAVGAVRSGRSARGAREVTDAAAAPG